MISTNEHAVSRQAASCPLVLFGSEHNGAARSLDEAEVWEALSSNGAVLFHGFGLDEMGVYRFATRLTRTFLTTPFRGMVSEHHDWQPVTEGKSAQGFHFEYGNSPIRPDLVWFYCRKPAAAGKGGETVIADGAAIFDRLSAATQRKLSERQAKYTTRVPTTVFEALISHNASIQALVGNDPLAWLTNHANTKVLELNEHRVVLEHVTPSVRTTDDGRPIVFLNVFTDSYRMADGAADTSLSSLVTWEDGTEIEREVLDELKKAAYSCTKGIRWRAGDFVLLDNNRVLHGRTKIGDPERDILLLCSFSRHYDRTVR